MAMRSPYRVSMTRAILLAIITLACSFTAAAAAVAAPRVGGDIRVELRAVGVTRSAVQWQRATAVRGPWRAVPRARSVRYVPTLGDAGAYLRVCQGRACSRPTAMVPPRLRTAPAIIGASEVGSILRARGGLWAGALRDGGQWAWQRRDGATSAWQDAASGPDYAPRRAGQVRVRQRVRNGGGWSAWADSPVMTIRVATPPATPAPRATQAPTITGAPREGTALVAADGTWADGAPVARMWLRCTGAECTETGESSDRYVLGAADIGRTLRLRVTARGSGGESRAESDPTPSVLPLAPVNTALPAVAGVAAVTNTLTAESGAWRSSVAVTYAYQWQRCADAGCASPVDIDGATAPGYDAVPADAGLLLRVRVRATDSYGQATDVASAPTTTVPPYATSPVTMSGDARAGAPLALSGAWSGATSTTWSWRRLAYDAVALSSGSTGDSACLIGGTAAVACWGDNAEGQVGDGTQVDRNIPTAIGLTGAVQVATGEGNACATLAAGGVACWGSNADGQLGPAASGSPRSLTPVSVSGITDAVAVAVGNAHACALRAGGGVLCWGRGINGQLGTGVSSSTATPTAVSGISDAVAVGAGTDTTCVLRAVGEVACFGANDHEQLGNAALAGAASNTPATVDSVSSATALAVGSGFACAIHGPGLLTCWGDNSQGQLGRGSVSATGLPDPLSGGYLGVRQVMAMGEAACLVDSTAAVRCWGDNARGQLANGTTTDATVPTAAPQLATGLVGFGAMRQAGMTITTSAAARAVGDNTHGQLGTAFAGPFRAVPSAVASGMEFETLADVATPRTVLAADAGSRLGGCSTATNAGGSVTSCADLETVAPVALRLPAVLGATGAGVQVVADPGAWQGALSRAYQWQSCADAGCTTPVDIDGATTRAYVIDAGLVGSWLRVRVTGAIDGRETTAVSAPVAVVS